ncbi:membrane primary amine oxidase-like [Python bivittatus]|uniref:Amine oxidase n=1 Tax=Python bivittatus TaxID=176946 RepID=A0A9F2R7B6_PYTBI|nr:membrane primary amine oxidase-like [Python bivittatus]
MNQKALLFMLFLALLAVFALVCVLLTRGGKYVNCASPSQALPKHRNSERSWLFADLSQEEIVHVVQYLKSNLGATLEDASRAKPSDNCIYSVDLELSPKAETLSFLDHGGSRPPRQALAVVYFGNQPDPNVTEYVVGPLPQPMYHRDVTVQKYGGQMPYYRRPPLIAEHKQMAHFLHSTLFPTAPSFMREVLNYDGTNLAAMPTSPKGMKSGDRATWLVLYQNVTGYFLHPVGLEVLIDHSSLDISHWIVKKVFYGGQYYRDMAQLEREFTEGHMHVEKVNRVPADGGFSSMKPRVHHANFSPLNYEPFGPHYSVKNNQVHSSSWSFAYRMDLHRGPQLFDIRFKNERIVYELSVQDTLSVYGSSNPGGMSIRYMDGSFGIGKYSSPLMRGLDCPYSATYLDVTFFAEVERPIITRDAICVFEQDMGVPFRRHFSKLQSLYYGGLKSTALVFRSVSTIGNYDYVWDFVFYPNGAIESKVRATGYISSSYFYNDGLDYGNRVGDYTLGTIHTHFVGFKLDLDVGDSWLVVAILDVGRKCYWEPWGCLVKAGFAYEEMMILTALQAE